MQYAIGIIIASTNSTVKFTHSPEIGAIANALNHIMDNRMRLHIIIERFDECTNLNYYFSLHTAPSDE